MYEFYDEDIETVKTFANFLNEQDLFGPSKTALYAVAKVRRNLLVL